MKERIKASLAWMLIFGFLSVWLIAVSATANVISTHYVMSEQQAASRAGMEEFDKWLKKQEKPGHTYLNHHAL